MKLIKTSNFLVKSEQKPWQEFKFELWAFPFGKKPVLVAISIGTDEEDAKKRWSRHEELIKNTDIYKETLSLIMNNPTQWIRKGRAGA